MKKILLFALAFFAFFGYGIAQTYTPATCCTVSNKAYGAAQAVTSDGRSWFYDATNFVMRDYNGTSEVLSYLNLAKYRSGHFPVFVHSGGVLQGNGVWVGGITLVYWFKDSTGNANLVRWYTDSTGTAGGPFYAVANNLSEGNAGLIKGNLSLDLVNNTSDAQKNAAAVALTNHTIDGNSNTLLNIANSSLAHSTIGLNATANSGSNISVTTSPAALGNSLVINFPDAGTASRGPLTAANWNFFNGKLDSVRISNDSVYNCVNGTCTLQSVISGTGGVNSVDGTNASLIFSPTTGNVLGQVNPAFTFNWTGQHSFLSFAPIFSTLTTAGGLFYGDGFGQLLETGAGSSGQILQSNGGTAPTFFLPDATTVNGWLGYTALSNALGSTHLFIGNGSNIATDRALTGDASVTNTGVWTNTGLKGHAIPTLAQGNLQWTGSNWVFNDSAINQLEGSWPIIISNTDSVNLDLYDYNKRLDFNSIIARGDSVYWYGDSWTVGQNCTGGRADNRYSTVVSQAMDAIEVNFGVNGSVLEKRSPLDPFVGQNMVDRLGSVPTKHFNQKMIVYSFGLNDWGVGGGNYDSANFETDYDSVIHYTLLHGWDTSQILIISPPWVGHAAALYYSTVNGGTVPTAAALRSFVNASINVANRWRIHYVDIYHAMLKNDTTLFDTSGQGADHPCDSGYAYLGAIMVQYLSPGVNGTLNSVPKFVNNSALGASGIVDDGTTITLSEPLTTAGLVTIGNPFGRIAFVDQANGMTEFALLATSDHFNIYDVPNNEGIVQVTQAGYMTILPTGSTLSIGTPEQNQYAIQALGNTDVIGQMDVSGPTGAVYFHQQDNNARTWAWYSPEGSFRANNGADELVIATTGQVRFNAYGTGAFTGTPTGTVSVTSTGQLIETGIVTSGTYTPSLTNTTNISSSSNINASYSRNGNVVHVVVAVSLTLTSANAGTVLTLSLPINSSTHVGYGSGVWNTNGSPTPSAVGIAGQLLVTGANSATFSFYNNSAFTASQPAYFAFDYTL